MDDPDSTTFNPTADISSQLMQRYSSSSATQHRHLIATAAAMSAVIHQNSLPPTPLSYFAAAMSALSDTASQSDSDTASSSALATLLSIALPLVPEGSISPEKAADAVGVLVRVLGDGGGGGGGGVKCVVKCLGVLLGFCDFFDWDCVELGFQSLVNLAVDKRPKVRKCALVYLENALKSIKSGPVTDKASELILSSLENCISSAEKLGILEKVNEPGSDTHHEAECSDIVYVLGVVKVALPYLSDQVSVKVVKKLVELIDARLSAFTRIILSAFEVFLEKAGTEVVTLVAEDIIDAVSLYVYSKTNSTDSLVLAANVLKIALGKLHSADTVIWHKCFPPVVKAIAGLLTCEDDVASKSSNILKSLIDNQLADFESHQALDIVEVDPESNATSSICSVFLSLLEAFADIPNEHILVVLSVLFLKLGRNSSLYMKKIVLKLAENFTTANDNKRDTCHLQKCFGCAVVALGAEEILSLVPISFNEENLTCSNLWLLPILKKYTFGASLRYFMDNILPVAKSLKKASRKVKKSGTIGKDLQAHAKGLWGLLPAFCRHPTDVGESFQSLSKLMLAQLKNNTSRHEDITDALQELARTSKYRPKSDAVIAESPERSSDLLLEDYLLEKRGLIHFSKKDANRNMKTLSSQSKELLQSLMTLFLDSPAANRTYLKKAISCLASISKSSRVKRIFILSLERFPMVKAVIESGDLSDASQNDMPSSASDGSQWPLSLDLASSLVEGADEDFLDLVFRLAKHSLQAGDEIVVREAYYTLSCIFKDHPMFCSSNMDELVDLMKNLKSPTDITSFRNRLSCLRILLVSLLKTSSDVESQKPFIFLNYIILALKDSKEDTRKVAYDELLKISSCFEESSANSCGLYYKLISMILGYLSGTSPHITSAAVSALSVLVFQEPELCLRIPDLVPSVTSLLHAKAVEIIKAVLGFIKVFVSCSEGKDLHSFASDIMEGLLPWSSVSRHHFRSKVTVIIEILIRKCGFPAVKLVTPERYQPFIKKVSLNRQGKNTSKDTDSVDMKQQNSDASTIRSKKRMHNETNNDEGGSRFNRQTRQKQSHGSNPSSSHRVERTDFRSNKKPNQFNQKKGGFGRKSDQPRMNKDKVFGRPRQNGPRNKQR